ncbi:hypothetical protein [Deminuibacter soli]|uniref:Uncharacterized protein n=1 Tax=Deminuibacter soli TaxID=2291815 RepID=A0A3E1NQG2_9BACT|nr:hypothetical protein [Deminuibacter soli]RFM30038.1 hypothetical protein DXN05_03440 [Deminuibacter soli]
MSHPQKTNIEAAIVSLKTAKADIEQYLAHSTTRTFCLRATSSLDKEINMLSALVGADLATAEPGGRKPLTHVLGRPVASTHAVGASLTPAEAVKTAEQAAVSELRAKAEELYQLLPSMENDALLDTYSEIELRAVGKKAGLPVTDTEPAKIDGNFLNTVREAIAETARIAAAADNPNVLAAEQAARIAEIKGLLEDIAAQKNVTYPAFNKAQSEANADGLTAAQKKAAKQKVDELAAKMDALHADEISLTEELKSMEG